MPWKLTQDQFIQKAKQVHGDKYDYSKVIYKHSRKKVIIICQIHGKFKQNPNNHLNGQGCLKCKLEFMSNILKYNTQEFVQKAKEIHGNKYNYSLVNYLHSNLKVNIICPKHNVFRQKPIIHLRGYGCQICNASKGELTIKAVLDKHNIQYEQEYKFDTNYRFEYDFYLPDHNLLIEFHGIQHYKSVKHFGGEERFKRVKEIDTFKRELAKLAKIPLLEFNYKHLDILTKNEFEMFLLKRINNI